VEQTGRESEAVPEAPPGHDLEARLPGRDLELRPRAELDRPARLEPTRYAPRFQFFYGVLLALGIVAIAAVVLIATRPAAVPGPPWSSWRPSNTSPGGAQQIADHVGPTYRLPDGAQLVSVRGGALRGPLQFKDTDALIVVKATSAATGDALVPGHSLLYTMCGEGVNCSISFGKPSVARRLLLSREAFEIALYSFRYIGKADNVVVILPPTPKETSSQAAAILLQRSDFSTLLDRPLDATLSSTAPGLNNLASFPDMKLVNAITTQRLYHFGWQVSQDLQPLLELAKV